MTGTFKELNLKRHYDSDRDNLLQDFFIPSLAITKKYHRLAGFFSSGILSAAARGVIGLIEGGGHMQLMVGATLHQEDATVIEEADKNPEKYVEKVLLKEIDAITDLLTNDHVEALGWMLANNLLEIKIGLVRDGGLFHLKVGVMEDVDGNELSFSGSDNETPSGWRHNIEEFKVFRNWIPEEQEYFAADKEKFERFWTGAGSRVRTIPLPEAVRKRLVSIAPKKKEGLRVWQKKRGPGMTQAIPGPRITSLHLHQLAAIEALNKNGGRGILAMATGAGKTLTALEYARQNANAKPLCVVVALPYVHLVNQWIEKDIKPMFPDIPVIEIHGQAKDWKTKLPLFLAGFRSGAFKTIFIAGLYGSLASPEFTKTLLNSGIGTENLMLIADEVHNAGAPEARNALLDIFDKRVGLSATPERYFDEEGTDVVKKFFGGVVYEYSLEQAIKDGHLAPYDYFPIIVRLTDAEYVEYQEISARISRAVASATRTSGTEVMGRDDIKRLLIQRSKLIKGAGNKIPRLASLLGELNQKGISNTLIYCDGMDQLEKAQDILNNLGVINHKFTQNEPLQLRDSILKNFASGVYKALIAIKCLDEGVDVPATRIAIIVASTTNPREFIQRRGRVLRKDPYKSKATVYDFIVVPPGGSSAATTRAEKTVLESEFHRVRDFIETASNKADIYEQFLDIMREFGVYL